LKHYHIAPRHQNQFFRTMYRLIGPPRVDWAKKRLRITLDGITTGDRAPKNGGLSPSIIWGQSNN